MKGESASKYLSVNLNDNNSISNETIFWMSSSRTPIHFSKFDGFNNDKYIINICGYKFSTKLFSKDYKGNAEAQQFSLPLALGCCAIGWACARQQNGE